MAKSVQKEAEGKSQKSSSKPHRRDMLSTGSTLLNLACTGNPFGGFLKGKYHLLVGDSTSGKTFLAMTCFAEATDNRYFKDYRLIYDNVEDGCLLDLETLFNKKVAARIEPPASNDEGPIYSSTIEEFYYHVDDAIDHPQPFVYVLDSMDALSSKAAEEKFDQHKKAHREEKKVPGSYTDGKAKMNSQNLREVVNRLRNTGSILIIVSQTRDSFGLGFGKTRSGGHALKFYATIEVWSSVIGQIRRTVRKKERIIGVHIKLKVKKNRITGKTPEAMTDIYPSYGIDDIGTCIDYLLDEKWWEKEKETINAPELDLKGTRATLIRQIEGKGLVNELRTVVGHCWKMIEDTSAPQRKKRY